MQFVQVKLATSDPEALSSFYVSALGCEVVMPLSSLGEDAGAGAGVRGSEVQILVLGLPGVDSGPNLEMISGTDLPSGGGILTFYVDDVEDAAERVVAHGGSFKGEVTDFTAPAGRRFRYVFMSDPEGNVIDLFQALG